MEKEQVKLKIKDLIWSEHINKYKNKFLAEEIYIRGSDDNFVKAFINQNGCCINCKTKFEITVRDVIKLVLNDKNQIICKKCVDNLSLKNIKDFSYITEESDDAISIIDHSKREKIKWIIKK
jgi:hypothetical protein